MNSGLAKTLARTALCGALLLFLMAGKAAADGCHAGEILVAQDEKNNYCLGDKSYKKSAGPKLAAQYCATNKKVGADQAALRNLGFSVDAERAEIFAKVSEKQKEELKRKVALGIADHSLAGIGKALDSAKSLNPWNVNKAVKLLEEKGFGNPQLIAALREVASVRGKPEMAAAYKRFEELARSALEGYGSGTSAQTDPGNTQLQLLAGALKTVQGNPELGLLITTFELGESLLYLAYVGVEVDDLARETDDKLARLGPLGARLKADALERARNRASWRSEMQIPIAPLCGR